VRSIDKDFDNSAMRTVRHWKFEPAKSEGEPVELEISLEIEFRVGR
jgi:TonB family protein